MENTFFLARTKHQRDNRLKSGYWRRLLNKGYISLNDIEERFEATVIEKIAIKGNVEARGQSVVEWVFKNQYPLLYNYIKARSLKAV